MNLTAILKRGSFASNALTVMAGTASAQLVSILVSPILTRLFPPHAFGTLAVYSSIAGVCSAVATLRYHTAIPIPRSDSDAEVLVKLSLALSIIVASISCILSFALGSTVARTFDVDSLVPWIYLLPISVVGAGVYQTLYFWAGRHGHFRSVSGGKVLGGVGGAAANISLGFCGLASGGLIVGSLINQWLTTAALLRKYLSGVGGIRTLGPLSELWSAARKYDRCPKLVLPADLINSVAQEAFVFLLSGCFSSVVVGLYSVTQRVVVLPSNLVAAAFADVFRQRASADYANTGSCRAIYLKTLKSLALMSLVPLLLLIIFAPAAFRIFFGAEWKAAGEYARIMAPLFAVRFVVSPLTWVFYVSGKQKYDLWGQVMLLTSTIGSIYIGSLQGDPRVSLGLVACTNSLVYAYYLILSYRFSVTR